MTKDELRRLSVYTLENDDDSVTPKSSMVGGGDISYVRLSKEFGLHKSSLDRIESPGAKVYQDPEEMS